MGNGLPPDKDYLQPRKFTIIHTSKIRDKLQSVVDIKITDLRCTIVVRLANQLKYLAVEHNQYWKFRRAAIALYESFKLTLRFNKMNSH